MSFPVHNVGPNLPNLYATVAGNLFELGEVAGLKVLDLPDDDAALFPGPAFGAEGARAMAGVRGRPLVGTIVKPRSASRPRTRRSSSTRCVRPTWTSSRTTN